MKLKAPDVKYAVKHGLYMLEFLGLAFLFLLLKVLGPRLAPRLMGWFLSKIGRLFPVSNIARKQLQLVFPRWSEKKIGSCLKKMWHNLGANLADYAHLGYWEKQIQEGKIKINNARVLEDIQKNNRQTIFVSAHIGNWEINQLIAKKYHHAPKSVYRRPNNAYVNWFLTRLRRAAPEDQIAKGPHGARKLIRALKQGDSLAIMIDQKMNTGVAVPLFGYPAMTADAVAHFCLRFDVQVVPMRVIRTRDSFIISVEEPLRYKKTRQPQEVQVMEILKALHSILEGWITEHPEQWFWLHKRWPRETLDKHQAAPYV